MRRLLRLFCPTEYVNSVVDIDIAELKKSGVQALLIDLDNTLVPWRGSDIRPKIARWVAEARRQGIKFCIVSNTNTPDRLQALAHEFGVPFVRKGLKPRRSGFREALRVLGIQSINAAVVGDQVFTDILGGNRLRLRTILVRPMHHREFIGTKVSRFFERIILASLTRRGLIKPPAMDSRRSGEQSAECGRQM